MGNQLDGAVLVRKVGSMFLFEGVKYGYYVTVRDESSEGLAHLSGCFLMQHFWLIRVISLRTCVSKLLFLDCSVFVGFELPDLSIAFVFTSS